MDIPDPKLEELLIGEVLGLRLLVRQLLGRLSACSQDPDGFVEKVRQSSIDSLSKHSVQVTAMSSEHIKARAEFSINDLCDSIRATRTEPHK